MGHAPTGWPSYGYVPPPPPHPSATTPMVLGLIGLIGGMACFLPIVASPFAWFLGRRVVKEIDAHPGQWSGRDTASAGQVMGIIGTALLALGILAFVVVIAILVATEPA